MSSQFAPEDAEELDFVECESCSKKPGMPVLCDRCLHNRHAIFELKKHLGLATALWKLREEDSNRILIRTWFELVVIFAFGVALGTFLFEAFIKIK